MVTMDAPPENKFTGEERRRSPRIQGAIVEYSLSQYEPFKDPAFIKDISAVGVCIYQDHSADVGTILYLKIHLFGDSSPITAEGKVVRLCKSKYMGFYELGIELSGINAFDKKRIEEFVSKNQ